MLVEGTTRMVEVGVSGRSTQVAAHVHIVIAAAQVAAHIIIAAAQVAAHIIIATQTAQVVIIATQTTQVIIIATAEMVGMEGVLALAKGLALAQLVVGWGRAGVLKIAAAQVHIGTHVFLGSLHGLLGCVLLGLAAELAATFVLVGVWIHYVIAAFVLNIHVGIFLGLLASFLQGNASALDATTNAQAVGTGNTERDRASERLVQLLPL
jgi:hypothetical protein